MTINSRKNDLVKTVIRNKCKGRSKDFKDGFTEGIMLGLIYIDGY